MADVFTNLARQMLSAAPEVGPLLPPRFAPWRGVPLAGVAPWPQELADAPARADAAPSSPPLIDPAGPAAGAPLPTFRQMSELRPASGPPVQPGQPAAQDTPETTDFEPATTTVIQAQADSDTDAAVTASPAPTGASGERPSKEVATTERDQAVPPPPSPAPASTLQPAPRPAAGQERSASSARLPDPPARMGRLLRYSHAGPVEAQPEPVEAQPEPVEGQPEPVEGHAELVEARRADIPVQPLVQRQAAPGGQTVAPLAPQPVPAAAPGLPVSTQARAAPTTAAPALATSSLEPAPPAGRAVPGSREPTIVPAPESAPGEMWSTTQAEAVASLRPPSARPTTGEPEPAPTVRVTIGRVVVRAAPADERPPVRRVELPRPPLSLEEYLRGRQGGTR